LQSVSPGIKQS